MRAKSLILLGRHRAQKRRFPSAPDAIQFLPGSRSAQFTAVVAINSALEIDVTGQVCADSLGYAAYRGIAGQVDFIRGAARSKGGNPISALASTDKSGTVARIVPALQPGAGVVTSRGDVHYVVTEYGVAHLHGKTVRERVEALIAIAHPAFRDDLLAAARHSGILGSASL